VTRVPSRVQLRGFVTIRRPFVSASAVVRLRDFALTCFKLDSSNLSLVHLSSNFVVISCKFPDAVNLIRSEVAPLSPSVATLIFLNNLVIHQHNKQIKGRPRIKALRQGQRILQIMVDCSYYRVGESWSISASYPN
jgi:hypothetical protein